MIETCPRAAPYPPHWLVILESHNNPVHGDIIKNNDIYYRNEEEQVEITVIPMEFAEVYAPR
jgi:hypothetical protein